MLEAVQETVQEAMQKGPGEEEMVSILGFLLEAFCPSTTFLFVEELATEQGISLSFCSITSATIASMSATLEIFEIFEQLSSRSSCDKLSEDFDELSNALTFGQLNKSLL